MMESVILLLDMLGPSEFLLAEAIEREFREMLQKARKERMAAMGKMLSTGKDGDA